MWDLMCALGISQKLLKNALEERMLHLEVGEWRMVVYLQRTKSLDNVRSKVPNVLLEIFSIIIL